MMQFKKIVASLISIITIIAGGYLLFNVAFLVFALVVNTTMLISGQSENDIPRILVQLLGYIAIGLPTFLGLKFVSNNSQFIHTLRATFLTLPLMALLVTIGIALYQQSDGIILAVGGMIILPILVYLYFKKLPWMYWLAVIYVAILGIIVVIKDIQI